MKAGSSDAERFSALETSVKGVLVWQCIATLIVLVGVVAYSYLLIGGDLLLLAKLKAASYGAALAMTGTLLSARSMRRSGRTASKDAHHPGHYSIVPVFSGLLNKLIIVGGGIGLGLIIGLNPIVLVIAYLVVQFAAATQLLKAD